ncbi:hypothetical protein MHYP_G00170180 [Metynnis hypsauchen]
MKYETVKNGSTVTLQCGEMSKGSVIWSRDRDGRREDILTIVDRGGMIKHVNDTPKHYNHNHDARSLMITRVSSSHAGLYYCNSSAVCLTVTSGPNMTNQDKCETRSAASREHWMPLVVVGSVVLLLVLALVSTRKWFSKKKAEDTEMADHVYASIDHDTSHKAQTGIKLKERNKESVYYLANHPDPVPTGLQNELTYSEIQDPANRLQNNGCLYVPRHCLVSVTCHLSMMEHVGFLCLLLCGYVYMVSSETLHVRQKEGNVAVLRCGQLTKGSVTWSRDINGQRVDILTTHNGKTTKHITDNRYGSGPNLVLTIFRVSESDAGRYYCSGATVELSVTSVTGRQKDDPKLGHRDVLKVVFGIVTGSCVVAVVLLTSLGLYLYKMREQNKIVQLYANVQMP